MYQRAQDNWKQAYFLFAAFLICVLCITTTHYIEGISLAASYLKDMPTQTIGLDYVE